MSNERKQILEMLAEGKINADEAERLLDAVDQNAREAKTVEATPNGKKPKFIHIQVEGAKGSKHENVNIKVPIMILKAGMKLGTMIPDQAKEKMSHHLGEKGINLDLSKLRSEDIDVMVAALSETSIDVDTDTEKVRIFCA